MLEHSEPGTPTPPKQKLHRGFASLGFATPWVTVLAAWSLTSALISKLDAVSSPLAPFPIYFEFAVFAGIVAAFVIGFGNGDNRLRSFGIGGLVSYVVGIVLGALVVGALFLLYSGWI